MPLLTYASDLTASILDGPTGYEPQRQNNGLLTVTIPGGQDDSFLQIAGISVKIPNTSNPPMPVPHLNEDRKYAGKAVYEDIQVTLIDYIDVDVAIQLQNWRQKVSNPNNGKIGWKRTYAGNGFVYLFGPNGQGLRSWEVIGIWPSAMDPGQIDQSGGDTIKVNITFAVDKSILQPSLPATDFTSGTNVVPIP